MHTFSSLSEAIRVLKQEGYTEDFNLLADCLECQSASIRMYPQEFQIDESFRFDVDTDPGDQSILYAISSAKYQLKGLLLNAYGIYADPVTEEMAAKLRY